MSVADGQRSERHLRELLGKINHPLLEVRSRCLRGVAFKLKNGIVAASELVHERAFLAGLLEWFNFEEWALESQVLGLIAQLAEHETAAQTLVEVGGVEFLSQLRLHCNPSLHPLLDEILEQLLKLPESALSADGATPTLTANGTSPLNEFGGTSAVKQYSDVPVLSQSSQYTFTTESTSDFGSYPQISVRSFQMTDEYTGLPQQYLQKALSVGSCTTSSRSDGASSSPTLEKPIKTPNTMEAYPAPQGAQVERRADFGRQTSHPHFLYGSTPAAVATDVTGSSTEECAQPHATADEKNGGVFPWLRLSVNDRHILATTESRLQSSTPEALQRSCEFIHDVLIQDFPAELFLQRPALVKCLLKLLDERETGSSHYCILQCLLELTGHLKHRMALYRHAAMGSTDKLTLLYESEPVCVTSATVLDRAVPTPSEKPHQLDEELPSSDVEHLTPEMLFQLQSESISLQRYYNTVFTCVALLLLSYMNRDFPWMREEERGVASAVKPVAAHISLCLQLLFTVSDLSEQLNTDGPPIRETQTLECLSSCLGQCLSKWRRLGSQASPPAPQLQTVCTVTVCLARCLGKMLSTGLPSSNPLPAPVVSILRDLIMNGVILATHPELQDMLLPFLERADPSNCKLFKNVRAFSRTFKQKTAFHASCKQKEPCSQLISLATDALPGLLFVCDEEFVTEAMKLCTQMMTQENRGSGWDSAKLLLLRLLGHESERVQELAYGQFKNYLISGMAKLEHQASESPTQEGESRSCVFPAVLDCDVMKELCCYGALSSIQGVCSTVHEILATLLNLREELYWPELRDALLQWLPFIEVSTANHDHLCKQFQELLDAGEASGISRTTELHSYLRLLFSENTELRVWSFTFLCKLLISDDSGKLSPFSSEASLPLHDVLLLGKPSRIEWDIKRQSSFQRDDVAKLLHILRSPVMDTALKKSALEQLAMLLQDCSLHELALEEGILADLLTVFEATLHGWTTSQEEGSLGDFTDGPLKLLNPCVRCLQLLTHSSATLRGQLSANDTFLLDVFRASLLCHKDPELLYSASQLLASLLFAPIARFSQPGNETSGIQLPESITNRLRFPFPMGQYTLDPCHSTPSPLEPKLLSSEPSLSMLRLHYHIAMAGGVGKLATANKEDLHAPEERLAIPESDFVALRGLHVSTALSDSFERLEAAASHKEVIDRLHHLGVVLQGFRQRGELHTEIETEELDWKRVLERYLTAHPATPEDSALLASILQFIHSLLCYDSSVDLLGPLQLAWLAEVTSGSNAVCLLLLQSFVQSADEHKHSSGDPQRTLQKTLLQFYASLMGRIARTTDVGGYNPLTLVQTLCQCLDVAGSPNYYDLPLLESSLECLKHLTASHLMRKVRGTEWLTLFMKLMTSLRQVLWSFLSGRGSLLASFMGKGVTSQAALSLSHLLPTTTVLGPPEGWWLQWLQSSPDSGLLWLHLLVEDREPQVQYAGLSLLASLCSQSCVVEFVLTSWTTAHPLGLWGVCLCVALDSGGCSLIKQQALFVLVSLSAVCIRQRKWNQYLHYNTDEFTLQSQQALEVLLDHFKLIPTLLAKMQAQPFDSFKQSTVTLLQELPLAMTRKFSQPSTLAAKLTGNTRQSTKEEQEYHDLCKGSDFQKVTSTVQQVLKSCNPQLISGACRLLSNLLLAFPVVIGAQFHNHGFIKGLIRILDPDVLKLLLLSSSYNATSHFSCSAWVKMATNAVSLLRGAVLLNPDVTLPHLLKEVVVASLCRMFACVAAFQESRQNPEYFTLCYTIMALLQCVVEKVNCTAKAEVVFSSLQQHWESFVYLLCRCLLQPGSVSPALRGMGLKLLCSILAHRFQDIAASRTRPDTASQALTDALKFLLDGSSVIDCSDSLVVGKVDDGLHHRNSLISEREKMESRNSGPPIGSIPNESHNTSGSMLCEALLKAYDGAVGREHRRGGMVAKHEQLISVALGILLACSTSAKQSALKSGLMESTLEQMKMLHAKLCMESLDQASQSSRKKKESPLMTELIAAVNLLRNFMYKSLAVKCAALESHLPAVIYKLWPWCTVERRLLLPVLRLLTVITAQHAQGRVSLASSGKGSNSLLHSILKLASHSVTSHDSCSSAGVASPHLDTIRAVFTLLANCALSPECRAVMKKVNFLSSFLNLTPKSEKAPASGGVRLSTVWSHFLGNLTLSAEGQQMIAKTPGSLDVLLDIYQCTSDDTQIQCLLVLRNLCFYGPNKTILSSNETFLMALSSSLCSDERKQTALAASAVWALLHNCSKIKNSLKKASLSKKLENIDSTLKVATSDNSSDSDHELCRNSVSQALSLIQ